MTHSRTAALLGLAALAALARTPAHGQATTSFNRATFDSAAGPTQTITFDTLGATSGPATGTAYPGGLTTQGVTFSSSNGTVEVIEGSNIGVPGQVVLTSGGDITAVLPGAGVTAVGFDIKDTNGLGGLAPQASGGQFQVSLFDQAGNAITAAPPGLAKPLLYGSFTFIGFTSSTPISRLTISPGTASVGGGHPVIDNFSFSSAPEPPQAAAMGLGALGLSGLALAARRRKAAG